jgi:hypothetical protein
MMRDLHWSPKEKRIARQAFEKALHKEFETAIETTKKMATQITDVDDLWKLEEYLTNCRKGITQKYDYRYAMLVYVCNRLIVEERISFEDLNGLKEGKLNYIRSPIHISS